MGKCDGCGIKGDFLEIYKKHLCSKCFALYCKVKVDWDGDV